MSQIIVDLLQVDLIVCYDVSKSPIRLVQRMGRTGRKREGKIIVLVTEVRFMKKVPFFVLRNVHKLRSKTQSLECSAENSSKLEILGSLDPNLS